MAKCIRCGKYAGPHCTVKGCVLLECEADPEHLFRDPRKPPRAKVRPPDDEWGVDEQAP